MAESKIILDLTMEELNGLEEYKRVFDKAVENGYIKANGQPLKCGKCKSKNLKDIDIYLDERGYEVEYKIICADCSDVCGYWAYGIYDVAQLNYPEEC